MTKDYTRSRATAERLLAKFGATGAIRRTVTTGNPWDPPGSSSTTVTNHACTLVALEYTVFERSQSLVQATDRKVLVSTAGLAIEPTPADQVVIGGDVMAIIDVKPLKPADVVIMWELQARA